MVGARAAAVRVVAVKAVAATEEVGRAMEAEEREAAVMVAVVLAEEA